MLCGFLPSSELPKLGRVIRAMRLVQPTHPEVGDGTSDLAIPCGPLPHVNPRNVVLGLDRNCYTPPRRGPRMRAASGLPPVTDVAVLVQDAEAFLPGARVFALL